MLEIASKCSYNIGLLQMMLTTSNVHKSCFVYLTKKWNGNIWKKTQKLHYRFSKWWKFNMGIPTIVDAKSEIKLVPNFVKSVLINCYDGIVIVIRSQVWSQVIEVYTLYLWCIPIVKIGGVMSWDQFWSTLSFGPAHPIDFSNSWLLNSDLVEAADVYKVWILYSLRNIFQTVGCGIRSFPLHLTVDFCGLRETLSLTCCSTSLLTGISATVSL